MWERKKDSTKSCPTLAIPWTVAHQAPVTMGFSRQEHWSGLPFPSPGELPNPHCRWILYWLSYGAGVLLFRGKGKGLVGLQIFKYGTGVKVQTFGLCWEASSQKEWVSESMELAPATESESGVDLRHTQRGQCLRVGLGSSDWFLVFSKACWKSREKNVFVARERIMADER